MSAIEALVLVAFAAQGAAMFVDERTYHRRRGLPRWERLGHPLDTVTVLACYAWLFAARPTVGHALAYAGLVAFSSLFVTKDEPVHAGRCSRGEQWLHALLFVLHPAVLIGAGWLWWTGRPRALFAAALALTACFAAYQLIYWNAPWGRRGARAR
jgi:hypothetical protein